MTILGVQMLAAYLYYIKCNTKQNRQCPRPHHNPLGLAFWQGRVKVRSGLTLPQYTAKTQPLRVGLSKPSAYRRVNTQINPNHQTSPPQHKPLGLVFWQGRRWSEATTLPRCAAKVQPLRVGLSKSSAYIRLYMLINQTTKAHPCTTSP